MQMFGQAIQIQPPHPGVEESHYMLHGYFKPDGKVLFGMAPKTAFDSDLSCPTMPDTGGMASPAQTLGGVLLALAGGLAVVGVAFAAQRRRWSRPPCRQMRQTEGPERCGPGPSSCPTHPPSGSYRSLKTLRALLPRPIKSSAPKAA